LQILPRGRVAGIHAAESIGQADVTRESPMTASYNDAKHWRDRASEMRALSANIKDVDTAAKMLRLADDYDNLADRAEATAASRRAEYKSPSQLADHGWG
jgi:pectin methylesterase-like acyl-CoA thioesterase